MPTPDLTGKVAALEKKIELLEQDLRNAIREHAHDGGQATLIDFDLHLDGLFETVAAAPTGAPRSPYDQVKIYVNGATYRLYWFDAAGNAWHYVTATA